MNVLNKTVSFFPHGTQAHSPEAANLDEYLHGALDNRLFTEPRGTEWNKLSPEYRDAIRRYFIGRPLGECVEIYRREIIRRNGKTPFLNEAKKFFPGITASGYFTHRNAKSLAEHSGLIALDIDFAANPYTPESLKAQLKNIVHVAYIGLSISGTGLWILVKIAHPDKHAEHYNALERDFAEKLKITLDKSCKDVCRFRFYAPDPCGYFNPEVTPYENLLYDATAPRQTPAYTPAPRRIGGENLAERAARYLIENRVSLECTYANFMQIAFACKYEWGDAGKDTALDILHACTTFAASNTARKFDTLWRNIKRETGKVVTGRTLAHLAEAKGFKRAHSAPQLPTAPPITAAPIQTPINRTEPPTEQLAPPSFIPDDCQRESDTAGRDKAHSDLAPPQQESLSRWIDKNPAVARLDTPEWEFEGVEPITEASEKEWQKMKERAAAIVRRGLPKTRDEWKRRFDLRLENSN